MVLWDTTGIGAAWTVEWRGPIKARISSKTEERSVFLALECILWQKETVCVCKSIHSLVSHAD